MIKILDRDHCIVDEKDLLLTIDKFKSRYRAKFIPYEKSFKIEKGEINIVSYEKISRGKYFVFVNYYKEV